MSYKNFVRFLWLSLCLPVWLIAMALALNISQVFSDIHTECTFYEQASCQIHAASFAVVESTLFRRARTKNVPTKFRSTPNEISPSISTSPSVSTIVPVLNTFVPSDLSAPMTTKKTPGFRPGKFRKTHALDPPGDPPKPVDAALLSVVEVISNWITQSEYINLADNQTSNWEDWCHGDIYFYATRLGYPVELAVKPFFIPVKPGPRGHRTVSLTFHGTMKILTIIRVYTSRDLKLNPPRRLSDYFRKIANDKIEAKFRPPLQKFRDYKFYVIGISSGSSILEGLRDMKSKNGRTVKELTREKFFSHLSVRHHSLKHIQVPKVPSPESLGYVLSWAEVALQPSPPDIVTVD